MHNPEPLSLPERLIASATLWSAATGRSLGALASVVVNHGSFFELLQTEGASTTTATLEKFARYLTDPANWPEDEGVLSVPKEVCEFAHAVGVSSAACVASAGFAGEKSGLVVAAPKATAACAGSGA